MKWLLQLTDAYLLRQREAINRELLKRYPGGYECPDCMEYGVCGIYGAHQHDRQTGKCLERPVRSEAE